MPIEKNVRHSGRPSVLTEELAKKIARNIENMPDNGVAVSWNNVIDLVRNIFGCDFRRNVLSQKMWNGRRIIGDAFTDAKVQERGVRHQALPKYASASIKVIRTRLESLEREKIYWAAELEYSISVKRGEIDLYRLTRLDLRTSVLHISENTGHNLLSRGEAKNGGRKEVLDVQLALNIVKIIKKMPYDSVFVTWDNIILKIREDLGFEFRRNVLSQKKWNGRKLIAEAYSEAKALQFEWRKKHTLVHEESVRVSLRNSLAVLESEVKSLKNQLVKVRLNQLQQFENYQVSRPDLRVLLLAEKDIKTV